MKTIIRKLGIVTYTGGRQYYWVKVEDVLKLIDVRIKYWKKFLKDKGYKKGTLDHVRLRVIIMDFEKLKSEIEG